MKARPAFALLLLAACATAPEPSPRLSAQSETVSARVRASADDAEEREDGQVSTASTDLELSFDTGAQTVGVRFAELDIPQGAVIERARLKFSAAASESGAVALELYAQDADDAAAFSSAPFDLSSRPLTRASATWRPLAWRTGDPRQTGDLRALVQEVVSRPGWERGNALALLIRPRALPRRTAASFDGNPARAPSLELTYRMDGSAPDPSPDPEGWRVVFEDSFSGGSLSTSKWNTSYHFWNQPDGGSTNEGNDELQWYLPENVSVAGGSARLTARRGSYRAPTGKRYGYTSGILSSHRKFEFTYGYMEMRAKLPQGQGLWPAFWTLPIPRANPDWPPEIDIMEVLGHEPSKVHFNLHYLRNGLHSTVPRSYSGPDLSAGFHTYGCLWEPGRIVFYLDGVERHRVEGPMVPSEPMYLLLNLAVGGDWPGAPDGSTSFPADFVIDYVRVLQEG